MSFVFLLFAKYMHVECQLTTTKTLVVDLQITFWKWVGTKEAFERNTIARPILVFDWCFCVYCLATVSIGEKVDWS